MRTTTVDDPSAVHACAVPGSDEQLWEMTARFLGDGLAAGEQVVYFDDGTVDAVLERLVDDRVPVDRPLADGQLTVVDAEEHPRSRCARPVRDAARMLAAQIDEAVDAGYTGLRMTGQFNYGLLRPGRGRPGRLRRRCIDTVLAGRPAPACCASTTAAASPTTPSSGCARCTASRSRHPALYDDGLLRVTRGRPVPPAGWPARWTTATGPSSQRMVAAALDDALRGPTTPPPRSSSTCRRCASSTSRARWRWCTRPRSSPRRTGSR